MKIPPVQIMLMGERYVTAWETCEALARDLTTFGEMIMRCKADGTIERIALQDIPAKPWMDQ